MSFNTEMPEIRLHKEAASKGSNKRRLSDDGTEFFGPKNKKRKVESKQMATMVAMADESKEKGVKAMSVTELTTLLSEEVKTKEELLVILNDPSAHSALSTLIPRSEAELGQLTLFKPGDVCDGSVCDGDGSEDSAEEHSDYSAVMTPSSVDVSSGVVENGRETPARLSATNTDRVTTEMTRMIRCIARIRLRDWMRLQERRGGAKEADGVDAEEENARQRVHSKDEGAAVSDVVMKEQQNQ